jgi:hypothetical protein
MSESVDATEAPPWNDTMGPAPRVRTWPAGEQPALDIRIDGEWRHASVLARHDWPDGRVSYQVELRLPDVADGTSAVVRAYWWDPAAMRAG